MQSASWKGSFESLRDYANIPVLTLDAIIDYVIDGRRGGDFVSSVLKNDLAGAYRYGDLANLQGLWATVTFLINRVPAEAWGSELAYMQWKGLRTKLHGVVIPASSIDRIVDDWRQEALAGIR